MIHMLNSLKQKRINISSMLTWNKILFTQQYLQDAVEARIRALGGNYEKVASILRSSGTDVHDLAMLTPDEMRQVGVLPLQRSKFRRFIKSMLLVERSDENFDAFYW